MSVTWSTITLVVTWSETVRVTQNGRGMLLYVQVSGVFNL